MTALQYLALEYQLKRLDTVVNDIRWQKLMPNTERAWDDIMNDMKLCVQTECSMLSAEERAELERQLRLQREEQEYKARLARERGRGAFGATYTGD